MGQLGEKEGMGADLGEAPGGVALEDNKLVQMLSDLPAV